MEKTASQTVHDAVNMSKLSFSPLDIHDSALRIATMHGIDGHGIWLIEQALVMVGSRAGISMKLGRDNIQVPVQDNRCSNVH